jgi:hypothetical protein
VHELTWHLQEGSVLCCELRNAQVKNRQAAQEQRAIMAKNSILPMDGSFIVLLSIFSSFTMLELNLV